MFDNKRWKYNPHERRCSSGWSVCACVCVRVCVCVCARVVCVRGALQNRQAKYTLSFGRVQTIKYTKHVKTDGLESIHLKQFIS